MVFITDFLYQNNRTAILELSNVISNLHVNNSKHHTFANFILSVNKLTEISTAVLTNPEFNINEIDINNCMDEETVKYIHTIAQDFEQIILILCKKVIMDLSLLIEYIHQVYDISLFEVPWSIVTIPHNKESNVFNLFIETY